MEKMNFDTMAERTFVTINLNGCEDEAINYLYSCLCEFASAEVEIDGENKTYKVKGLTDSQIKSAMYWADLMRFDYDAVKKFMGVALAMQMNNYNHEKAMEFLKANNYKVDDGSTYEGFIAEFEDDENTYTFEFETNEFGKARLTDEVSVYNKREKLTFTYGFRPDDSERGYYAELYDLCGDVFIAQDRLTNVK